ncbi:flagellar basal body P-ring formation chaperone FlgA [Halomonas sp. GD1P12]|uniref:flagellar basal body P-ring formation chaperone FlgA n=1 Tax=Halomonas sp. GD1P12 TaxID=2982691 RepID=UPI0021E4BCBA|nr:flagellar basal body P-ring formation chaperone FlgA [Halomonas sp. GD1P12]UYG00040.1 flagellar basal body P-ring formation chaperone FlgA [Halomonas sp. GD1P12]
MPYSPSLARPRWARALALCLIAVLSIVWGGLARAQDQALVETVQNFLYQQAQTLGQEVVIDVAPPSPHLATCIAPEPFLPNAGQAPLGRVSVGVRCGEARRQVRYMQAQVDVMGSYTVAAQDIARNTMITPAMVTQRQGSLGDLAGNALTDENAIIGMVTQRPIRSGDAFQAHALKAPEMVERGERVTVIAQGSGFRISREGEALEGGALNARIRVRFDTRELVTARITGDGTVTVDF